MTRPAQPLVVLHSSKRWLTRTKTWIYEQLRWLPAAIEAHVVCAVTENLAEFPFGRLHVRADLPRWRQRLDSLARRSGLARLEFSSLVAQRIGARVLHSHFGPGGWGELPLARAAGLRQVVTFYGYDVTQLPERLPIFRARYRELFQRADRVLCEGPHMRSEIVRLGCPENKVKVQHLGVDIERIAFEPRVWQPGQRLQALIAASFREKKGIPFAIRALGELFRARPETDLELAIIGDAGQSADQRLEKSRIEEAVRDSGLAERVKFLGFQPHATLLAEARKAHIFVSPSVRAADGDTEGGAPVALIEMAASGLPVVSTRHCDIPNVLRGPAAELLAPERDVAALRACLERLIDAPQNWASLQTFVRREIESRFDSRRQGQALAEHYAEVENAARGGVAP